jgi:hypothetical protein
MISESVLWHLRCGAVAVQCTVTSACAGVDVRITQDGAMIRRERYPDRSVAYERARAIRREYEDEGYRPVE